MRNRIALSKGFLSNLIIIKMTVFSANVTGNEAELALMKEYYPTATSVADSYSNQLAGN